jgi:hypothetical protein
MIGMIDSNYITFIIVWGKRDGGIA